MKVYIMYEVAGAMGHVNPGPDDNPETMSAVTREVNAAIEGAVEAGATVLVQRELEFSPHRISHR